MMECAVLRCGSVAFFGLILASTITTSVVLLIDGMGHTLSLANTFGLTELLSGMMDCIGRHYISPLPKDGLLQN